MLDFKSVVTLMCNFSVAGDELPNDHLNHKCQKRTELHKLLPCLFGVVSLHPSLSAGVAGDSVLV